MAQQILTLSTCIFMLLALVMAAWPNFVDAREPRGYEHRESRIRSARGESSRSRGFSRGSRTISRRVRRSRFGEEGDAVTSSGEENFAAFSASADTSGTTETASVDGTVEAGDVARADVDTQAAAVSQGGEDSTVAVTSQAIASDGGDSDVVATVATSDGGDPEVTVASADGGDADVSVERFEGRSAARTSDGGETNDASNFAAARSFDDAGDRDTSSSNTSSDSDFQSVSASGSGPITVSTSSFSSTGGV